MHFVAAALQTDKLQAVAQLFVLGSTNLPESERAVIVDGKTLPAQETFSIVYSHVTLVENLPHKRES